MANKQAMSLSKKVLVFWLQTHASKIYLVFFWFMLLLGSEAYLDKLFPRARQPRMPRFLMSLSKKVCECTWLQTHATKVY